MPDTKPMTAGDKGTLWERWKSETLPTLSPGSLIERWKADQDSKRRTKLDHLARWAPLAGQLADATTTAMVISRGGREVSPVMQPFTERMPLFFAAKVALGMAQMVAVDYLRKSGHPRLARVFGFVSFGFGAIPAAHNVGVLRRM